MRTDLLQQAAELARTGTPFALAVVVRRLPASSSREGDMALVSAGGDFLGWLGGSCTQPMVVREAQAALADGKPRLLTLTPNPEAERRPGVVVAPMTCHSGGTVEIYIDPILPAPRLAIFGSSPVAHAVAQIGQAMGYRVEVDAFDAAAAAAGPSAALGGFAAVAAVAPGGVFAVVCSMGENDEVAIARALKLAPDYLGVVASAKRFAQIRETLLGQGVPAAALDRVRCPAGLQIGARAPQEIALSVIAEIVQRRHALAPAKVDSDPPKASAATAIDPVCAMTVKVATAKHFADHQGRTYYFCCAGCRTKFLAAPASFLGAGRAE